MVSKATGLDGSKRDTKFSGVTAGYATSVYIDSAVKAGVLSGYTDGTTRSNEIVNRGQMAVFLVDIPLSSYSIVIFDPNDRNILLETIAHLLNPLQHSGLSRLLF